MQGKSTPRPMAIAARLLMIATILVGGLIPAFGQQLPVKHYNVEDGLGHSIVGAIYQDQKGYIWFGTADGLSRFDGYHFVNYTKDDGLESNVVTSITEDQQGRLWIGTTAGIARLLDDPSEASQSSPPGKRKKFATYHVGSAESSNVVSDLFFDKDGALWGASDEIYRAAKAGSGDLKFERAITHTGEQRSFKTLVDSRGRLWFGLYNGLIEVDDRQFIKYGSADGLPFGKTISRQSPTFSNEQIVSITEAEKGRVIVANRRELFEFVSSPRADEKRGRFQKLPLSLPVDREIRVLSGDASGNLWIGTTMGLMRYAKDYRAIAVDERSLGSDHIIALFGDGQGNTWAGTGNGVYKTSGDFIVSYTRTEGLPDDRVGFIVEGSRGEIYLSSQQHLVEIRNGEVRSLGSQLPSFSGLIYRMLRDSRGNYWITTSEGLYRVAGPELDFRRAHRITERQGAPATTKVFGLGMYEDAAGRIWCGAMNDPALYVFDQKESNQAAFKRIPLDKTPQGRVLDPLHCTIADHSGEVWFGWQADLGRYRNGKLELIDPPQGLNEILPRAFLLDSRGWLWIGQQDGGALVTKTPTAEHPQFINYSTRDGLANNTVGSIAEDNAGRIYLSTGKGLDRLDPTTGAIHHFTVADGMAGPAAGFSVKDHEGNIWVAMSSGLSKLNPRAEHPTARPPPVYFSHVQISGEDYSLPERGAQSIRQIELPSSRNNLLVEFVGLDFLGENKLRYQYKLEGVDKDWSPPSDQRSVNFAKLAPGTYRLLVRAINAEGFASVDPSIMELQILPPIWQRWWFIALVAGVLFVGTFGLYRMRVGQIVAMERIRRQVATDLHDDVGSGLAQIAILSEVAKRETTPDGSGMLSEVADLARSMRESMSDIVWAVDPRKDSLSDLVQRMRQATFNLLEANGIRVEFRAPDEHDLERINLAPDRRRHLLLIFKETITNVARHAKASKVSVEVALEARTIRLTVRDNGCGFILENNHNGHGLHSLNQRANELKGKLTIESKLGSGTAVQVSLPVRGQYRER